MPVLGVPADATVAMHKHLKRALPERTTKTGATVEYIHLQDLPAGWNPNHGIAVVVADDANQNRETSFDRTLVRVAVHAPTKDLARKWGRDIHSYLMTPFGGMGLGVDPRRSTGVIVGPDSKAGGFVASMSVSCGMAKLFTKLTQ